MKNYCYRCGTELVSAGDDFEEGICQYCKYGKNVTTCTGPYKTDGYDNIVSTMDFNGLVPSRRMGNTTRQVDFAIQKLFEGYTVLCEDHHGKGSVRIANRYLFSLVLDRLKREHKGLYVQDKIYQDNNAFIIKLKRDNPWKTTYHT